MFQRSLFGSGLRAQILRQARALGSGSDRAIHAFSEMPHHAPAFSGLYKNPTIPYALTFKTLIHSGNRAENETRMAPPRSIDYFQGLLQNDINGHPPLYPSQSDSFQKNNSFNVRPPLNQPQIEWNADIVHIKLLRNNAFVTVTDSKGQKKAGVSAGQLAGKSGKLTRYSGDAAAEHIGRKVRQMKTRSVVVKVNGFTFFRRKKEAILSFKDGYTNSRGDMNPVVYLEDTTRKPHNGCRLPKKRRI
ncbi:30S ribosomal protein s11 [Phtheirospermum japonicum]|uniref:30S ribosomal protein s11 n=1 Tax=Phtheirospermum japonicum TaxID=374723 RepID=A0A830B9T1_9LAMI|nr:30S ribosomal protein s11 [Phtheirospermum japonicum]